MNEKQREFLISIKSKKDKSVFITLLIQAGFIEGKLVSISDDFETITLDSEIYLNGTWMTKTKQITILCENIIGWNADIAK